MNINNISTQLLYTTVPIWGEKKNGEQVSGTGFIFSIPQKEDPNVTIPLLMTNYHVLEGVTRGIIEFAGQENNSPVKGKKIRVEFDSSVIANGKLENLDLIAIPIASTLNDLKQKNTPAFYRSITPEIVPSRKQIEELAAIEEITFIGYPSGLYDSYNVSPIVRRGITATPMWNKFKGEECFLIDAGVFPGSSGSPVFLYNQGSYATDSGITIGTRILFIGVLTESFIRNDSVFLGLGKVINSTTFLEHLKRFVQKISPHII
ncbi:hypothetical protein BHU72_10735 [Desulfuribacillus stibiiarsenatis]|uniref:Serine protease n=1 Tax=Desulfuribacillus stibiiarsenatis TaxID=1390249 RepID=A0A1E5L299_9FIRM|nr:serine protease [Desulfuribacillus stibiiarsenatis]OEH84282.1 hypothetical protein BHU72_10735 [Desulfuribacillus stibiiarsenatis]